MKTKRYILLMIFMLWQGITSAQIDSLILLDEIMNDLDDVEFLENIESISEDYIENLERIGDNNKININDLSYEVAVSRLNLSDFQYYQLQLYIENYGQLYSLYELLAIQGFTKTDLVYLMNKVDIGSPRKSKRNVKQFFKDGKNDVWIRYGRVLEKQVGYDKTKEKHYDGTPSSILFRYEYSNLNNVGVKIAGGKDPGDEFFRGKQKFGFDHYSGSIYFRNIKKLKLLVLGDFRVNFAQGLVFGSSILSGKGGNISGLRKFGDGLRPVAITNEGNVFRGSGATIGDHRIQCSIFGGVLTHTNKYGLGTSLRYQKNSLKIGFQIAAFGESSVDTTLIQTFKTMQKPEKLTASVDYSTIFGKNVFVGEFAIDEKLNMAALQSMIFSILPDFKLGAVLRYYSPDYKPVMASPFKSSSLGCGEYGVYVTSEIVISKNVESLLFADYYRLKWVSYRTDKPINGIDLGVSLMIRLSRYSNFSVYYRWRNKPKNELMDEYLYAILENTAHKIRFQWHNSPISWLKLKTEVSLVFNKKEYEKAKKGLLIYQDISGKFLRSTLAIHARLAFFDTDTYNERLYAYENDVYYAFNIGSYYYQGVKWYLMARYKFKNFSFWVRVGRVYYFNKDSVGSSYNLIDKPHKTEIKLQTKVRF